MRISKVSANLREKIDAYHSGSAKSIFEGKWFRHKTIPNLAVFCFGKIAGLGYAVAAFDLEAIGNRSSVGIDDVIGPAICVAGFRGKYSDFDRLNLAVTVELPRYAFRGVYEYATYYSYADGTWSLAPEGPIVESALQLNFTSFWDRYRQGS
jgi:hypothetical protein